MKIIFFLLPVFFFSTTLNASVLIDKISGFSLTNNSFSTVNTHSGRKATVVMFISKDCPCSQANLDYLNNLAGEFKEFHFIGVHSKKNINADEVNSYLKDKKLNFEVFNDSDLKIADQFKALKTPHVFIVNPAGEIVYNGGVTNTTSPANAKEHHLRTALTELQNYKTPSNSETRTLGCFISR